MNSSAHKNLAKFADAFKKHAYKTMDPRKSLDAVLPSSVKDKQKANLLNDLFHEGANKVRPQAKELVTKLRDIVGISKIE